MALTQASVCQGTSEMSKTNLFVLLLAHSLKRRAVAGRRDVDAHVGGGGERGFDQRRALEVGRLIDEEQRTAPAAADVVAGLADDR